MSLKPPILIVGATRSGTTMTMKVLGSAPGLCFFSEPTSLWRVGHAYRDSDAASAEDAKPWVKRWIRRHFLKVQEQNGGRRVVEKLPMNVLRIPYLRAIFPEAKIIHIYRDGRANIRSHVEQHDTFYGYNLLGKGGRRHLFTRLSQVPFWEWPAYGPRTFRGMARRYVLRKPGIDWFGIKYPGWREDLKNLTSSQVAAKQWVISVETALRELKNVPRDQWLDLRYEQVVTDPVRWFQQIADFCEVKTTEEYLAAVKREVHPNSVDRWKKELKPEHLDEAMPIMAPLLERLGYFDMDDTRTLGTSRQPARPALNAAP